MCSKGGGPNRVGMKSRAPAKHTRPVSLRRIRDQVQIVQIVLQLVFNQNWFIHLCVYGLSCRTGLRLKY